ncbi:hypothetical protein J1614_009250 [Plenodomus biglobosus]|nr:hypothetical protein J1614_009250 [Plenodomus biglobosus]
MHLDLTVLFPTCVLLTRQHSNDTTTTIMSHLESLPPEILYNIITFLEPVYTPTQPFTLLALSATSKQFNALVEEHANNALKRHGLRLPKRLGKLTTLRRKWIGDICQFCRKASKRRACFYSNLVCCKHCDRVVFPKITMTAAIATHHLSKLDLFTPNPLHPYLPQLRLGAAQVLGGQAILISEPDILARRDHIYALLGDKAHNPAFLRARPTAHYRILLHLFIYFCPTRKRWRRLNTDIPNPEELSISMRTREGRLAYAKKALRLERMAMGIDAQAADDNHGFDIESFEATQGRSVETAIELDDEEKEKEKSESLGT